MSRFNQPGFNEPRFNEPGFSTPGTVVCPRHLGELEGKHHRLFLLLLPLRGKRRLRKSFVAFPLPPKSALAPFPLLRPRRRPTSSFLPLDQLFHPSLVSERGAFLVGPIRPRPSSPLSFSFSPGQTFLRSTASLSSVALMAVRTCKELGVGFHHFCERERERNNMDFGQVSLFPSHSDLFLHIQPVTFSGKKTITFGLFPSSPSLHLWALPDKSESPRGCG